MVAGEGHIDGKYLDQNEADLKMSYAKFQNDWSMFGVTLMPELESIVKLLMPELETCTKKCMLVQVCLYIPIFIMY
jgi:hypothetical protein